MIRRNEEISSITVQQPGLEWRTAATMFVLCLLFFSFFTFRVMPPGDPAQSLYQILTQDLQPRPVFIGYTIVGIFFTSVFSALGLPVDFGLNFMSAVFGALGAAVGYLIALALVPDRRIALTATIMMALSAVYWYQAEIGDVYMLHYSLILVSMVFYLRERYLLAGASYGVAVLVYPNAALVVPFYLWVAYRKQIGIRNFFHFAVSGAIIYLPVVLINFDEYFFGRMGILRSLFVEPVISEGRLKTNIIWTVNHFGFLYTKSFNFLLLFVAYGLIHTFFRYRAVWLMAMSASVGPMLFGLLNHGTDIDQDPYFLPSILFLSVLGSLSLWHLLSWLSASRTMRSLIISVCLLIYGGLSYVLLVGPREQDNVALKRAFLKVERELPANAVLLSSWGISLAYNLYTRSFIYDQRYPDVMWTGRCQNKHRTTTQQIEEWLADSRQVYFLDGLFWKDPLKETVGKILPERLFRRLIGTKNVTFPKNRFDFVKMDTVTTGPVVLYQVLPLRGLNTDAVPKKEQTG